MRRMVAIVMARDTDCTIVRPSHNIDRPASGGVRVEPDPITLPRGDEVSRGDRAAVIVQCSPEPALVRKTAAVSV